MGLCYVAMTRSEMERCSHLPGNPAWLSCHFSPGAAGLSELPEQLPAGALLLLDDRVPPENHDPAQVEAQLLECMDRLQLSGVLLDFQRPKNQSAFSMARHLSHRLPCPVILTAAYADTGDGPVLLPPPPLYKPLAEYAKPWAGRKIWLEAATGIQQLVLTKEGCQVGALEHWEERPLPFEEETLFCKYAIEILQDKVLFTLSRTPELLQGLLARAQELNITPIALYQELYTA